MSEKDIEAGQSNSRRQYSEQQGTETKEAAAVMRPLDISGPKPDTESSLWSHDTISRDETSASDSTRDRLNTALISGIESQNSQVSRSTAVRSTEMERRLAERFGNNHDGNDNNSNSNSYYYDDEEVFHASLQTNLPVPTSAFSSTSHEISPKSPSLPKPNMTNNGDWELESDTNKQSKNVGPGNGNASENDTTNSSTIKHQELMRRIASLERENKRLKTNQGVPSKFQVLYFIHSQEPSMDGTYGVVYLDEPTWSVGINGEISLGSKLPITDVSGFLGQHPEIAFVITSFYTPQKQANEVLRAVRAKRVLPRPKHTSETIRLRSSDLIDAVHGFLVQQPKMSSTNFPWFNDEGEIPAPYLFWYHHRSPTALDVLSAPHRKIMSLLTSWIEEQYAEMFYRVGNALNRGVVTGNTMPFLVKPGDVLVWKEKGELNAVIAKGWACQESPIEEEAALNTTKWTVDSWRFVFDGRFDRKKHPVDIVLSSDEPDEEIRIEELNVHPLDYAPAQVKLMLEKRGESFWRCRNQYLVSYEDRHSAQSVGTTYSSFSFSRKIPDYHIIKNAERFMVDFSTYQQLHSHTRTIRESHDYLDPAVMASDEPPAAPSIYVFPNKIPGYNLRSKKWGKPFMITL